ncbi:hypothetical protein EYF80_011620 [Liparis tanakae]|uniref:Uncharacterized protein n=1 Tax=Liparis tanakae TaxID=230148 RepID=A0A4Z2IJY4_9TELE|nr:hypothetical protein EYF80_011620 [Liparis tanakae]
MKSCSQLGKLPLTAMMLQKMLPVQEGQSTAEARNSSSQVSVNDVTEQEEGSLPRSVVYHTDRRSRGL